MLDSSLKAFSYWQRGHHNLNALLRYMCYAWMHVFSIYVCVPDTIACGFLFSFQL